MANIKLPPARQLQQVLSRYISLKNRGGEDLSNSTTREQFEVITSMVAALERLAPPNTYYSTSLKAIMGDDNLFSYQRIPRLAGVTEALKTAYESGYLYEIEELIHADVFSDFIYMAEYLLKEGFKDPAAVIVGGVLEEHLRKLCLRNSITTIVDDRPKKAEMMNSELATKGVFNKLDQKSVTAWLDLRNKAAHGRYTEYVDEQVQFTLSAIRDFISRFPA